MKREEGEDFGFDASLMGDAKSLKIKLISLKREQISKINFMMLNTYTSISPGYGLLKRGLRSILPVDALLIRDEPLGGSLGSFISLPESFMEWLESYPNITLISPKAENRPLTPLEDIGILYTEDGKMMDVLGIIGIIRSEEANITGINQVVTKGNYLEDDDLKGILVSSSLRESLKVDVGDKLYGFGQEFIIRGFFDDEAIEEISRY